jgi:hypothetical protein
MEGVWGNSENVSALSAAVHLLLCPSKIFRHGNKNTLFLAMAYSALFKNAFKALDLFLNK